MPQSWEALSNMVHFTRGTARMWVSSSGKWIQHLPGSQLQRLKNTEQGFSLRAGQASGLDWLGMLSPFFLMLNNGAFCMLGRCEVDKPSRAAVLRDQGTPGFKCGEKKQRSSPLQSREALRSELNYQLQAELHLETTGLLLKIRGANKLPAHSRSSEREAEKKGVVLSNSYFPVSL